MKKYKTRIKFIEAVQLSKDNLEEVCRFIGISEKDITWRKKENSEANDKYPYYGLYVPTVDQGLELVLFGEYIIKDENYNLSVCHPEIFSSTYEEINPGNQYECQ